MMQTHAARLMALLQDAGYRFIKADIWECQTGPEASPELVGASKSLGDLIRQTASALGVDV